MLITGTVVPMVTPTTGRDGTIDERALTHYTEHLVKNGVHGLFPCGSIGEFSSLTAAQRRRVIETVVDAAGDTPVLAGCGDTSVGAVQEHVKTAADAGADAAVVVTPYYLSTTQRGLVDFYHDIAATTDIPLILYNIPALTGEKLDIETVIELSQHETIVGIKDTSGDSTYHRRLINETPDEFSVLQGSTELAVSSLDTGADGIIAGPANVFPGVLADVYNEHAAGNRDRAVELMNHVVNPILTATSEVPTAAGLKYLLTLTELETGSPLPPLPQLDESERAALRQSYQRATDGFGVASQV
ncbi:dihydrodipicolinate synthase family protein [Haloferax sp. DFSO52]|uniref:dihydrodipicolinate synthase family protein n=1 Tax=Haloferax sp. DFSO52 TaxID=3388505 RepID=UPI003A87CAA7